MNPRKQVTKMLAPEELSLLSNIESIINELKQMNAGGMEMASKEDYEEDKKVMMQEDEMPEEDKKDEDVQKSLEETPSDSATASDDAEDRIDETLPEVTEENVSEVEKALRILMNLGKKDVKKSKSKNQSPVFQALKHLADIQKSNQKQIHELSTALSNVLEGLGVVQQLEVTKSENENRNPQKINKTQTDELLDAISKLSGAKVEKVNDFRGQSDQVRKNLGKRNVLQAMLGQ